MAEENPMRQVVLDKVTLNIGVGQAGESLENAKTLLERLSGSKAVPTKAKSRNPLFKIRKGDLIGTKTTLRGKEAFEFLQKALKVRDFTLGSRSFDRRGNFSFGVPEYIDFPGAKYDPKIGIIGFDVCVTLKRRGARVSLRRRGRAKVGGKHRLTKEDGIAFAQTALKLNVTG